MQWGSALLALPGPSVKQLYKDTVWLISPKSFSNSWSCPKMAAWEIGKLFVLEVLKQEQHDHSENKTFWRHLTLLPWLSERRAQSWLLTLLSPERQCAQKISNLLSSLILTCSTGKRKCTRISKVPFKTQMAAVSPPMRSTEVGSGQCIFRFRSIAETATMVEPSYPEEL